MARPPIIISNGGVFCALAKDCAELPTVDDVIVQMKDNLKKLNIKSHGGDPKRSIIRLIESNHKQDPRFLWCLADEPIDILKGKLRQWGVQDPQADLSG